MAYTTPEEKDQGPKALPGSHLLHDTDPFGGAVGTFAPITARSTLSLCSQDQSDEQGGRAMRRRTFDILMSAGGAVVVVVLVVAGGLLMWGYTFSDNYVHDQLSAQKITFPPLGSKALASSEIGRYLNQYAGQPLTTGPQAEAYANHFIRVHLSEVAGGQTYAQVSGKAQADPTNAKLKAQAQTLFQGETLRGLLLSAYGFWKFGQIALFAGIAALILSGVMLVLVAFGFVHARRTSETEELLGSRDARIRQAVLA